MPSLDDIKPVYTEFIQVGQLKNHIDESGLALDLELIVPTFSWASYRHPQVPLDQFRDSMSPHQIYSKAWILRTILDLAEHFSNEEDQEIDPRLLEMNLYRGSDVTLAYFGSWLGFGAAMVAGIGEYFSSGTLKRVTMVDKDPHAMAYAMDVITALGYNGRYLIDDMLTLHPKDSVWSEDIIVNPVCEHLTPEQLDAWWGLVRGVTDKKRLIILQSTNMPAIDHVNRCDSPEKLKLEGLDVLYAGELKFNDCSRFMVVGSV